MGKETISPSVPLLRFPTDSPSAESLKVGTSAILGQDIHPLAAAPPPPLDMAAAGEIQGHAPAMN